MKSYMIVALALTFVVALPSCKGCKKQKEEAPKTEQMPAPMPATPAEAPKPAEAIPAQPAPMPAK